MLHFQFICPVICTFLLGTLNHCYYRSFQFMHCSSALLSQRNFLTETVHPYPEAFGWPLPCRLIHWMVAGETKGGCGGGGDSSVYVTQWHYKMPHAVFFDLMEMLVWSPHGIYSYPCHNCVNKQKIPQTAWNGKQMPAHVYSQSLQGWFPVSPGGKNNLLGV